MVVVFVAILIVMVSALLGETYGIDKLYGFYQLYFTTITFLLLIETWSVKSIEEKEVEMSKKEE